MDSLPGLRPPVTNIGVMLIYRRHGDLFQTRRALLTDTLAQKRPIIEQIKTSVFLFESLYLSITQSVSYN